ncbi:MAG: hypothetical protein ABI411_21060 [Tahibacter sp.]
MMDDSARHDAGTAPRDSARESARKTDAEGSEAVRLRGLRDSLDRAWHRVRGRVAASPSGSTPSSGAASPPNTEPSPDPSLHSTFGEFSSLGAAVADDALALAKQWGLSVSDLVRRHPVRAVLIAGLAGAAIGVALRVHRKRDERE